MTVSATGAILRTERPFSSFRVRAALLAGRDDACGLVVSPYRFNPLGAHVDHQGGPVLARTLDQYTLLAFWPSETATVELQFDHGADAHGDVADRCRFAIDSAETGSGDDVAHDRETDSWIRFARAATHVLHEHSPLKRGLTGVVHGTLIAAGLSSSASVVLAYLQALAAINEIELDEVALVELVRRVENEHLGLNNGVQDQMSVVFGRGNALSRLDVDAVTATPIPDPPTIDEVRWLLCYSGVSRELAAGSGFNTRVAECRQAAALLDPGVSRLGDVPPHRRTAAALAELPDMLARRARHGFTEMQRVGVGSDAWRHGDWRFFGELMNASCASSIDDYESGSEWLVALHRLAADIDGIHGSRFSGGGFGGCLVMLVERNAVSAIAETLLTRYLDLYPDKRDLAYCFVGTAEDGVRLA